MRMAFAAGTQIIVTLSSGERMEYQYSVSSATDLTVTDGDGRKRTLPKSEISQVTRPRKKDGLANGALIGLAVGAA